MSQDVLPRTIRRVIITIGFELQHGFLILSHTGAVARWLWVCRRSSRKVAIPPRVEHSEHHRHKNDGVGIPLKRLLPVSERVVWLRPI